MADVTLCDDWPCDSAPRNYTQTTTAACDGWVDSDGLLVVTGERGERCGAEAMADLGGEGWSSSDLGSSAGREGVCGRAEGS